MTDKLRGRTALITGAGRGIGRAIAELFAREGARVALADIDPATAGATAEEIGAGAFGLALDVADSASVRAGVDHTIANFGQLDILVNNAGFLKYTTFEDCREEDWDRIHRLNAKGVFFCLQRAAKQMIEQGGGCIINTASIAGRGYAGTSNAAYAASKGAVISLTRTASQQLGQHNINVNAICPGVTRTPLSDRNLAVRAQEQGVSLEEALKRHVAPIPIGRANQPEDIAALAVFLASPGARNITGQSYNVDGGLVTS